MFKKNINKNFDLPLRSLRLCGKKSGFPRGARNSGIALIMVLGLLTVMVLMAVTFAISMRTERLAAGNAADTVRARELVHVGLARAMDDIKALICMPSCFSIDDMNKIVLVRPNHDFRVGDEVRVFSPSNLPSGPVGGGLVTGFIYKVSDIKPEEYIIEQLSSNGISISINNKGSFDRRVIVNDRITGGDIQAAEVTGMRSYTLGAPIRIQSIVGLQYVIPVDYNHIKWAVSYTNALEGKVVNPLTYMVPDVIELQPVHGIYPVVTNKSASGNQLVYYSDRERLRTGMAVRLEPADPSDPLPFPLSAEGVYYVRCVSNQVDTSVSPAENNLFIQLCDSYTNAVANKPITISYPLPPDDKFIIIPVPSVISSNLALVSYSTNQASFLSDFSELVTTDSSLDTVQVTNNYHSGEAVTFTTTDSLPTTLQEKSPYYVVVVSRGVIRLAASIDDALSAPPITIDLVSGAGNHRMYKLGLSGEATNYIPMAVYAKAAGALASASSNAFVGIYASTNGELMGKVRYMIADCSGLLDANFVDGAPQRYWGNNPSEFQLANLPEPAGSLPGNRTTYRRYETLNELAQNLGYHPSNLFVYSYSQPEQWDPFLMNLNMPLNITGGVVQLQSKMLAISNGLWLAGFTNVNEWGIIYSNLIDYVDDDLLPLNLDYCVENVPMINEVAAGCSVKVTDNGDGTKKYEIWYTNRCECFYPFAAITNRNFTLDATIEFDEPTSGNQIRPDTPLGYSSNTAEPVAEGYIAINNHTSRDFNGPPLSPPQLVSLVSRFTLSVKLDGVPVDQLNVSLVITNKMNFSGDGLYNFTWTGAECLDPRFNFDPANPYQWSKEEGLTTEGKSMGDVNNWTAAHLYGSQPAIPALPTNDYDSSMFVANRPLVSAGELGYLVYSTNAPWKTVKLYGPDRHRVLDVFAIAKDANDWFADTIYNHGQINPNTRSLDVMKAWFKGMSVDKYPGGGGIPLIDSEALSTAQLIVNQAGTYTNLSDMGRVLTTFRAGISELEKESYFRNTCGLFNIHQNVFTVLIEAKAASGGNIPKNPAKQRAIAIVWRDPFTGEMFIRHIKWLGD